MKYVLDTHVWIWWLTGSSRLGRSMKRALRSASEEKPLIISDISLWEVALLVERKRIVLDRPLREWLEIATAPPLMATVSITPPIAAAVANLPVDFPRDPADRVVTATAQVLGATLLTADEKIIDSEVIKTIHT